MGVKPQVRPKSKVMLKAADHEVMLRCSFHITLWINDIFIFQADEPTKEGNIVVLRGQLCDSNSDVVDA